MTLGAIATSARTLAPDTRARIDQAGRHDIAVTGVTHDSRAVTRGTIFVAVKGQRVDATTFAADAFKRGAVAVVSETPAANVPGLWFATTDARLALAELAHLVYGRPSDELTVVGVTGTNGKTTTTYLLATIFDAAGMPCGRLGTVNVRVGPNPADERDAGHTTPEASDIQRLLREMVTRGCRACAMEVSSHALALHRVDYLRFSAGIFTNLTRDHLDFHGDMARYFAAKRRLFEMLPAGAPAIVNIDDPRGADLAASRPSLTFALDRTADVWVRHMQTSLDGLQLEVETPRGRVALRSPLVGRANAYNIAGAVAAAVALDLPVDAMVRGVGSLPSVPGRFQVVSTAADAVRVVVDYAHTDDALKHLLETVRPLVSGRLITVFGCGGDRDRTKRPLMGAVAGRLSDLVVVTSDNPRSEDPQRIIDEIVRGLAPSLTPGQPPRGDAPYVRNPDRRSAIEFAVRSAHPGDLVVIAGKGHEKYQIVADRTLPFDDVDVASAALARRRAEATA